MKLKIIGFLTFVILFLTACSSAGNMGMEEKDTNKEQIVDKKLPKTSNTEILTGKTFNIIAKEANHQLNEKVNVTAWTFNGSVPGSQIRVKEGEDLKINLKNELPDPVSIHWHGIPLPNNMDGIPGVTQNAVQPGESFTYKFNASVPGTYMYHTHQDGVNQVDKGLYGSLIIEPKEVTYDRDYSLMLDEWMSNPEEGMDMEGMDDMKGMDHSNMSGMDDSDSESDKDQAEGSEDAKNMMAHDMSNYDIFTINGKSGKDVEPLTVKEGEKVRLRLANIGYMSHKIHLHGHNFKVVAIDGQELNEPHEIKDQLLSIAPGERYDIEFVADNPGRWYLECHGEMEGTAGMKTVIQYDGSSESNDKSNEKEELPVFNFTTYGESTETEFTLDQKYDVEYTMDLNTQMKGNDMAYTINGKTFPDIENLEVSKGDFVKVKLVNNSKSDDHPMHLHGHFFQILSKNGKPVEGSPIYKDTVNLKPGDKYVVAFKADNPGDWMFHCHDLHHASAGMMNMVKYKGFEPDFTPDPAANNKPE
ncbi:multicopper oxidase family protein [Bacillus sp. EB93]|nr:multicopper oxidase family protein [Peribacillus frigoritolerans]